jgi:hypothetical protein
MHTKKKQKQKQSNGQNQNSNCLYFLLVVGKNEKNGYDFVRMDIIGNWTKAPFTIIYLFRTIS